MSASSTPAHGASTCSARSGLSGRSNSATMAAEWPVKTGTRTQVQVTARSGTPRILRASLAYFCSSSVSREPSSTILNCSGMTLCAIGTGYTESAG